MVATSASRLSRRQYQVNPHEDNPIQTSPSKSSHRQHQVDYNRNPTDLFQLIENSSWEAVISVCRDHPDEAKTWVVRREGNRRDVDWCRLPLHEACFRKPTEEVIDALLEAHPLAAQARDHVGRLPLHHACFYGASTEVVHKLLLAYPESIEDKDDWEKTPLDVARAGSALNLTPTDNREGVIDALSKGAFYWFMIPEKEKWTIQEEKKRELMKEQFQQERDAYELKITQGIRMNHELEHEIAHLNDQLTAVQKTLEQQRSRESNAEEISRKYADALVTNLEVKREFEGASCRAERLEDELRAKTSLQHTLESEVESLTTRLNGALNEKSEVEKKVTEATSRSLAVDEKLESKTSSGRALEAKVEELNTKLIAAGEALASNKISHVEEVTAMKSENAALKTQFSELIELKAALEKKIEEDSKAMASMAKSNSEYYLHSTEKITDLQATLAELTAELASADEKHKKELSRALSQVESLESMVMIVTNRRSVDNEKSIEAFHELERNLSAAVEQQERMKSMVIKQRQTLESSPIEESNVDSKESSRDFQGFMMEHGP